MPRLFLPIAFSFFIISAMFLAQPKVDPANLHERIIAVVPMIGAGTYAGPKRPLFTPAPGDKKDGIVGFSYLLSDDGKSAIVEIAARDTKALAPLLQSGRNDVLLFRKGKDRKEDIERELKRFKRDLTLNQPIAGGR